MKKKLIAFDLDGTLAESKSPMTDRMAELMAELLTKYQVCIISGGGYKQFTTQVVANLEVQHHQLLNLHLLPTCGTRYYRFDDIEEEWKLIYEEDIPAKDRARIIKLLDEASIELGYKEPKPYGDIIEDRLSQITFSACGQQAPVAVKDKWDPDMKKRLAIKALIDPKLPNFEVRVGGATSVDVTKRGIDKAFGMTQLIQTLEIGKDDILFIGDKLQEGGNDYPVKAMGIDSIEVKTWHETALIIDTILKTS